MIISVLVMMAILAISERSLLKRTHMEHNAALRASEPIVISSGSETDDMDRRAPAAQNAKKRGGPESTEVRATSKRRASGLPRVSRTSGQYEASAGKPVYVKDPIRAPGSAAWEVRDRLLRQDEKEHYVGEDVPTNVGKDVVPASVGNRDMAEEEFEAARSLSADPWQYLPDSVP